jgi:hypothetical protein
MKSILSPLGAAWLCVTTLPGWAADLPPGVTAIPVTDNPAYVSIAASAACLIHSPLSLACS